MFHRYRHFFVCTHGFVSNSFYPCPTTNPDFTRLKLVQGKKEAQIEEEMKRKEMEKASALKSGRSVGKENSADITSQFDAQDDEDVVF